MEPYREKGTAMSDTYRTPPPGTETPEISGWTGWIAFAGIMMLLLGAFHAFQGLLALLNDEYFLVSSSGLAVSVNYTAWGWVHLIVGTVIVLAGAALMTGRLWARAVGVLVAMVSAMFNVAFLAAYPVWSVTMIVVDLLVIWAITVHGSEMKGFG